MTAVLRSANIAVSEHLLKIFLSGCLLSGCGESIRPTETTAAEIEEALPISSSTLPGPPACTTADLVGETAFADEGSAWTIESTWVEGQWWQFDARIERHIHVESEAAGWRTPRVVTASMVLPFDIGIRKNGRRAADEFEVRFYTPRSASPAADELFGDLPVPGEVWVCRIERASSWECIAEQDGSLRNWPGWLIVPTALPAVDAGSTRALTELSLVTGIPLGISRAASRSAETVWTYLGARLESDGTRNHGLMGQFEGRTTIDVAGQRESVDSSGTAGMEWRTNEIFPHAVSVCWSAHGSGSMSELLRVEEDTWWSRVDSYRLDILVRRIPMPRNAAAEPVEGPPGG
jgi:hypothetical protein